MPSNNSPAFTILMTCIGGELAAQSILLMRGSTRHRIRVVGVDASPSPAARRLVDEFHVVPRGTDPAYVPAIARIAKATGANLVLPSSDEEAVALSTGRAAVEHQGCQLACTDATTIQMLTSKAATYAWLKTKGIATPVWDVAQTASDVERMLKPLLAQRGSAVVKPSEARGGRGAVVVRSDITGIHPQEGTREIHADPHSFLTKLLPDYAENFPAIVMQRLMEPVHDLDMLGWRGKPIRVVARRRLDSLRPNEGHQLIGSPALTALGTHLISALNLSWLYDCDVMHDEAGVPYVVEINPRPSGSVAVSVTAGVPLFDDMVSLALGQPVEALEIPTGQIVVPYRGLHVGTA